MKKLYALFVIALALFVIFPQNASAQTAGTVITMTTPDGKLKKDAKQKTAEFTIKGLNTQADVDQFVSKALAYGSVVSFTVSSQEMNGARECKATFPLSIDKGYFKGLLTHLGVSKVIINGKETAVADLGTK